MQANEPLECHVDILIEGAHQRFQLNIFQHHPVKAAEEAAAGAEGRGIAINHPQYADCAKGDNHLSQHGQNVLTADQAAVKQRNPRIVINRTSAVQIIINALSALSATAGAAIASPGRRANAPRPDFIVAIFIVSFPITVWSGNYSAASSASPVRMRMTRCNSATKILPSPIFPV